MLNDLKLRSAMVVYHLLFLVLINQAGFPECEIENKIGQFMTQPLSKRKPIKKTHEKYFDDMSLLCSFNYKNSLMTNPDNNVVRPVTYRNRTGHILPDCNNPIIPAWESLIQYVKSHDMKLNYEKTKVMLFNPGKKCDFAPRIRAPDDSLLEVTEKFKLLGVIIRADMRWCNNTDYIFIRAMKKMWMLRNLKQMGGSEVDLLDIYVKHIRSIAEYAAPVWNFGLTKKEVIKLERIQRISLAIIKGQEYNDYKSTCQYFDIFTLEDRRLTLCGKMAQKSANSDTFKDWFSLNNCERITRNLPPLYKPVPYRKEAFRKSPIPKLTEILNNKSSTK